MSDSVQPHGRQPTRLRPPWDSPGKNTGVGCHFLLQCMKVKSESEVTQSCPTCSNPMDCSLSGSSILGFSRHEYQSGLPSPSPNPLSYFNVNPSTKIPHPNALPSLSHHPVSSTLTNHVNAKFFLEIIAIYFYNPL